jgi:cobalamin synthase
VEPTPVTIESPVPIPVSVIDHPNLDTAPRRTTDEQDRVTAGQRAVNLIWETTQQRIALWVVGAALVVGAVLGLFGKYLSTVDIQLAAIVFLFGVANLVTGFYFGRTNHQRTGGVGGDSAGSR